MSRQTELSVLSWTISTCLSFILFFSNSRAIIWWVADTMLPTSCPCVSYFIRLILTMLNYIRITILFGIWSGSRHVCSDPRCTQRRNWCVPSIGEVPFLLRWGISHFCWWCHGTVDCFIYLCRFWSHKRALLLLWVPYSWMSDLSFCG